LRRAPLLIALTVLFFDIATKALTHFFLPVMSGETPFYPYGGIGVFQHLGGIDFSISHATNKGAAWGMLPEYQMPLLLFRIFFISSLLIYTLFFNKSPEKTIPFSLIIAGAFGNILDTFMYGHVIDMFFFVPFGYHYPVFNVADSAIFIGVIWLMFTPLFYKKVPS
jgi:signal peptidase II